MCMYVYVGNLQTAIIPFLEFLVRIPRYKIAPG